MREFTAAELERYNGKAGHPIYVAFEGKVYDLSRSFLWKNGYHQIFHKAGTDLTQLLIDAPHGKDKLEKYPIVGIMGKE